MLRLLRMAATALFVVASATGVGAATWLSFGGSVNGNIAVGQNADGRLEVFTRKGNALFHIWQTAPNNGWSGWQSLLGNISGPVAVGRNADGRLEVFARGAAGDLQHIWQTAPNNGWSGWQSLGIPGSLISPSSDIAVGSNADGRLEVFVRASGFLLWHIWQTVPNGGWSAWAPLPGQDIGNSIAVGTNADGRLEVFARVRAGITSAAVWHIWQTAPNGGWSAWASLGGSVTDTGIAIGRNKDGRLEVFARGTSANIQHIWQTAPNNGWSFWASLGGTIAGPMAVGSNDDGRLQIFVRGTIGISQVAQSAPNNGWFGSGQLGGAAQGSTTTVAVSNNADGRLEVFVVGVVGDLQHTWQTSPSNGWF